MSNIGGNESEYISSHTHSIPVTQPSSQSVKRHCNGATGVTLPLLQQSVLFFNLALSSLVLKKGLAWEQILGVVAVAAGVAAAAWPSGAGASIFQTVSKTKDPRLLTLHLDPVLEILAYGRQLCHYASLYSSLQRKLGNGYDLETMLNHVALHLSSVRRPPPIPLYSLQFLYRDIHLHGKHPLQLLRD